MRLDHVLVPWLEALRPSLPSRGVIDAHTHLGDADPDGLHCDAAKLLAALDPLGASAVVFSLREAGGYRGANERVLAEAAASGGRLIAFCRIDPTRESVKEAERSLNAGARGIKLHPRADGFQIRDPRVARLFALSHERRVPVLVHAGMGVPALGRSVLELLSRYPAARVILAHAGASDLAWIWRELDGHPNLFFDTAWPFGADATALFALVPPGRILYGSDAPYGGPVRSAIQTVRYALCFRLSAAQVRGIMGGQMQRLLRGAEPLDLGPPAGLGARARDPLLERVAAWLHAALVRALGGASLDEPLRLARLACAVGDDAPQAPACRSILHLLDLHDVHASRGMTRESLTWPDLDALALAGVVAQTPEAPLPESDSVAEPSVRAAAGGRC